LPAGDAVHGDHICGAWEVRREIEELGCEKKENDEESSWAVCGTKRSLKFVAAVELSLTLKAACTKI
jgi:hypothetical protein